MAVKSLVNEDAEMLGAAAAAELLAAVDVAPAALDVELDDDELPHAAMARAAYTASAATMGLLFSKCTMISSSSVRQLRRTRATSRSRPQRGVTVIESNGNLTVAGMNEALTSAGRA
jgi:RNA 3'-terminal phosphate cyclase